MADTAMKQKNVPELRFPEFKEELGEVLLGNVTKVQMGHSPKSSNYTNNSEHTVLVQGNADLKYGEVCPRLYTQEVTQIADIGDILLTVRAPVGEIGIAQMEVCIGRGVSSIKGNKFIYYFLEKFHLQNKWERIAQGSTFKAISGKDIKELKLKIPSYSEQQKIGDFFSKLDRQIELEEKKLDLLEEQKKGYMQKIFSQELRFKDEKGNDYPEWKENKLANLIEVSTKKSLVQDEYPVLTSSRNGLVLQADYYKDGKAFGSNNIGYFILPKGYITYRSRSDDGVFKFNINNIIDTGLISKYYPVFTGKNVQNTFLILLLNHSLQHKFKKVAVGTSQLVLSIKELKKVKALFPVTTEQLKIGSFFQKFDQRIELQSQKIGFLKVQKRGFLQKMFV